MREEELGYGGDSRGDPDSGLAWYFTKRPRTIITIPILLVLGINFAYHAVMLFLLEIDLFISNFFGWIIFGGVVTAGIAILAISVSSIPIFTLPMLWHAQKLWGVAKITLFIVVVVVSVLASGLLSIGGLWFVDLVGDLRLSLWWSDLWGVSEPAL